MTGNAPVPPTAARPVNATLRLVRFAAPSSAASNLVMRFADPAPREASSVERPIDNPPAESVGAEFDGIDIVTVAIAPKDDPSLRVPWNEWVAESSRGSSAFTIRMHGMEVAWRPGRAVIFAAVEQIEPLAAALVEFAYFEGELRKIEGEIAAAWPALDADKRLAFEVTPGDLEDCDAIRRRVADALERRIRHARIEPHLYRPGAHLPAPARKLGEELREAAHIEDRLETVDGQLEVFEHVYEMCSQRIGEFRDAHRSHTLEWAIIVLLAAETMIMLADLLWNLQAK